MYEKIIKGIHLLNTQGQLFIKDENSFKVEYEKLFFFFFFSKTELNALESIEYNLPAVTKRACHLFTCPVKGRQGTYTER